MPDVYFSFSLPESNGLLFKKFNFEPNSRTGPTFCAIVPNNNDRETATLVVKRGQKPDWDKDCILFQTNKSPQILTVILDTDETHPVPGKGNKPLFHFHKIDPKNSSDRVLIKRAICRISDEPLPIDINDPCGMSLPPHTCAIELHFDFSTATYTKPRSFDFTLKNIRDQSEHPGDPQVGNEPPGTGDPAGTPGGGG